MTKFLTEDEVRAFARDEWRQLREAEQARCTHVRSATITDGGLVCDQCGKYLRPDADGIWDMGNAPFSPLEKKHISRTREEK